jgi:hypothetical protein
MSTYHTVNTVKLAVVTSATLIAKKLAPLLLKAGVKIAPGVVSVSGELASITPLVSSEYLTR